MNDNELKEIDIENCTSYYFDYIIIDDLDLDVLVRWKNHTKMF